MRGRIPRGQTRAAKAALFIWPSTLITHDFNGLPIVFREDGYINMTKAAHELGKDVREFMKNRGTKEYMQALEKMMGIPINIQKNASKGRNGATFAHPKLAVFFARWLDARFAVWCDLMIDNILRGHIQTSVVVPTKEAVEAPLTGFFR